MPPARADAAVERRRVHPRRCVAASAAAAALALTAPGGAAAAAVPERPSGGDAGVLDALLPPPLRLEELEDADCLEEPGSEALLQLMSEFCRVLEDAMPALAASSGVAGAAAAGGRREGAWREVKAWADGAAPLLLQLSGKVFAKPYCEPGKVAGAAVTCLLFLLERPWEQEPAERSLECAREVQAMLEATAPTEGGMFDTRLHTFLRSPWPAFRLLDLLVRLFPSDPELAEAELGACRPNVDIYGERSELDWPWFRESLVSGLDSVMADPRHLALDPTEGPLSEQYRMRWARMYESASFRDAAAFSFNAFYTYRRQQWECGCSPGIAAAYIMQVVSFSFRDREAWLQRYVSATWRLVVLLTPLPSLLLSDWPVFRALHLASLLARRGASQWILGDEPQAGRLPAEQLQGAVRSALGSLASSAGRLPRAVYVTAAWGAHAASAERFLARWAAVPLPALVFLALDPRAAEACSQQRRHREASMIRCIEVPARFGVEPCVAKYVALAVAAQSGSLAAWLDLDVYLPADPTARLEQTMILADMPPVALAGFLGSRSLSPGIVVANGAEGAAVVLRYASWLYEHPYILDHQGWDLFLQNGDGDFSGSVDYKGRNITSAPNDGLHLSFKLARPTTEVAPRYAVLGREFASGDGWRGSIERLAAFHFWGAVETQAELFSTFYPFAGIGFSEPARAVLVRYNRAPASGDAASVAARAKPHAHVTSISYAHGCCAKSIARNRQTALDVGVDDARSYGYADLDPAWAERNADVLSAPKGAGWWLWKPHVILRTLLDEAVPWHSGVVLWLDAGNFFIGDPRPLISSALRGSDVSAMRLKCCVENEWTTGVALRRLGGMGYVVADRPQLGAYFIIVRKTPTAVAFVEEWLRLSEDPEIITDNGRGVRPDDAHGFQRHMADQSSFSVLFKRWGFEAISLEEGHQVVQLDRWRE